MIMLILHFQSLKQISWKRKWSSYSTVQVFGIAPLKAIRMNDVSIWQLKQFSWVDYDSCVNSN